MSPFPFISRLKVGPTVLSVGGEAPSVIASPRKFAPFLVSKGGDIEMVVRRERGPKPGEVMFESEGVWRVYRQVDGRELWTFRMYGKIYKSVLIDPAIDTGEIFFPRPKIPGTGRRSALQFPLDEMLFQRRWSRDGLIEVHSCGVVDGGGVLLFAGQSGAGKSTTARLWNHFELRRTILSDDRVLLDPREPSQVRAFGTPWHGTGRFGSTAQAPLRALFFLEQAPRSEAAPLHPAEAAARLLTRTFPPIWDGLVMERVVRACAEVTERIPAFVLRFRKDETAIAEARRAAAGDGRGVSVILRPL